MVPNIDPQQVRKLAGWGLTDNDRASFFGSCPQPSAVGPDTHQSGFCIAWTKRLRRGMGGAVWGGFADREE